jgi:integrase
MNDAREVHAAVAYVEKRGELWRARWEAPDGRLASKSGFETEKDALNYGRDQESAIRNRTYVDPRTSMTVTEWVNIWFPGLDLELSTLDNYRYFIEVHILPRFGDWELRALEQAPEEIVKWERQLPVSRRTAREARSTLTNLLNDAIPRYLSLNPAARRRGKGRKGQRRIEEAERSEKTWASPLQALLLAERCALLSGHDLDFVMMATAAYTGMRWSELLGLSPEHIRPGQLHVAWKLYELNGRFYRGRPKDGSIRFIDCPPFLDNLLNEVTPVRCQCRGTGAWCSGSKYVFLSSDRAHFRRSNYSVRLFRPAADGWYPKNGKKPAMPVLVDVDDGFPGSPVAPWSAAEPGAPFTPPTGRGHTRLVTVDDGRARCAVCQRTQLLRLDGTVIAHAAAGGGRCAGGTQPPAEDVSLACWAPLVPGATPHGLRHGHQPMMDNAGVHYVLQAERMGHEVPGMRGTYAHPTQEMRDTLVAALQQLWEQAVAARALLAPRSPIPVLDKLLRPYRER